MPMVRSLLTFTAIHLMRIISPGAMVLQFQARMDAGEDVPDCLAKTLIETREEQNLDWEDVCMLSAVFTLGGVHSVRRSHV